MASIRKYLLMAPIGVDINAWKEGLLCHLIAKYSNLMDPIHFINWHLSARFFVWSMPEPVWFYSRLVSCSMNTWFNDWLIFAWLKQMLLTSSSCFSGHDNKKDTAAVQMDTTVHYTRNTSPLSWTHKEQRIRYWCKTLNNLFQVGNKCIPLSRRWSRVWGRWGKVS